MKSLHPDKVAKENVVLSFLSQSPKSALSLITLLVILIV